MKIYYKFTLLVISLAGVLFLASCEEEVDLGPPPLVEFTKDKTYAEVGEDINFTNNSTAQTGSLTYNWDFGDGTVNQSPNPSKQYTSTGTYVVNLMATTEMGASEVFTDTVIVGKRYLTSIEVAWADTFLLVDNSVSPPDTLEKTWDVGDGPDIGIIFSSNVDENISISTEGSPQVNVVDQPLTFTIEDEFLLDNELYTFIIFDEDGTDGPEDDSDEGGDDFDIMLGGNLNPTTRQITFNPDTGAPGKNPETGEGLLFVDGGIALAFIYFEIR